MYMKAQTRKESTQTRNESTLLGSLPNNKIPPMDLNHMNVS